MQEGGGGVGGVRGYGRVGKILYVGEEVGVVALEEKKEKEGKRKRKEEGEEEHNKHKGRTNISRSVGPSEDI